MTRLAAAFQSYPRDERCLVALSGGRDSVALLHLLLEHGFTRLILCHLNHQLRGRAAAADARFVEKLAAVHRLELQLGEVDVAAFARERKLSVETAGRAARYAFFVQVARRRRTPRIFLGHHADDLVETFLFNLFRGAGTAGLASLRERSVHRVGRTELHLLRPLLGVWRDEIDAYIAARKLTFREDKTNRDLDSRRNRMRHLIIPQIENLLGRNIRKSVWRAATIAADEDALATQMLPPAATLQKRELVLSELNALPVAVQRRALRDWLRHHHIPEIGFDLVEGIRLLLDPANATARINLPGGGQARRRAKKIFLEKAKAGRRAKTVD